jgi:hypothetical protein
VCGDDGEGGGDERKSKGRAKEQARRGSQVLRAAAGVLHFGCLASGRARGESVTQRSLGVPTHGTGARNEPRSCIPSPSSLPRERERAGWRTSTDSERMCACVGIYCTLKFACKVSHCSVES